LFHPHLHCIVTGGGLSPDGTRWIRAGRGRYLFPVKVLGRLFRGKFLAALARARDDGELDLRGSCAGLAEPTEFARLKDELYRMNWNVYCKPPFGGPEHVFKYLGRYTHRVGISNQRLVSADEHAVTFRTRGENTIALATHEFIRRFLLHVLPPGFVKIRHFGLLAPGNVKTKLPAARRLLESDEGARPAARAAVATLVTHARDTGEPPPVPAWCELFQRLTGVDLTRCRVCDRGTIVRQPLPVDHLWPPAAGPPIRSEPAP
jgi:hypothetical protein